MQTATVCCLTLTYVAVLVVARWYLKRTMSTFSHPLPPGPWGLPFIGNITGFKPDSPWLLYAEWARKYGDLMYTRILGRDVIIINSKTVAEELLEGRSRNYSDRPYLATKTLCGRDFSTVFMEYGDRWRLHRRFFYQTFRNEAVHRFTNLHDRKASQLLQRFLTSPHQFSEHIFEYTASVILNSVYDYDAKSQKDELIGIILKTLKILAHALRPDISILVGAFPAILMLPSWLPGMAFKRDMETAKTFSKQYVAQPFRHSLHRLSVGGSAPCMVIDALRNAEEKGTILTTSWMTDLSHAAATAFIAGSDTSNSVISSFLLMMALNPDVQKKAQVQIDSVVCRTRLPTTEDRSSLPYIDAVLRETLRYTCIVPLSIPHTVVDDDVYAGYRIPKGALVITNLWSMAHDESKYRNSHQFIPERFLLEDGSLRPDDTENIVYGFGRRICVGRHFADASVWSAIVKILAVFRIGKASDENGVEIPIEPRFSGDVTIRPAAFQCSITPRIPGMDAAKLEQLIDATTV